MKIALPHCGFAPETNSGGETYEREILTHLAKLGVEFEIILAKGKRYPEGYPQFQIHELPIKKGLRWYISNWIWPHYLGEIEKKNSFDLLRVHSLRYTGPGTLWFNRTRRNKYPVVCHHHHIDPDWLNPLIEKRVIAGCDRLITGSEFSKKQLIDEFGIDEKKISVIPYGVDEKFKPKTVDEAYRRTLGLKNERALLFLAGLKKRKKIFFLIDIMAELVRVFHEPVKLVIAGSGPLLPELKQYAFQKQLGDTVLFPGFIPEERKIDIYNLCDLFVFPSEMEGFGFSPAEAMACGKTVIGSNVGSLPEIVDDGRTGYLVDNQIDSFIEKIIYLLKNPSLVQSMGKAGQEKVKREFQWDVVAQKTLNVYNDVVRAKSK